MNAPQPQPTDPTNNEGCLDRPIFCENDPGIAKIELRSELTYSLRSGNGKRYMMVQDELQSQYFRLGIHEWKIARLFDGKRTVRQVIRDAVELVGEENASPQDVIRLANWLAQSGLARVTDGSLKAERSNAAPPPSQSWQDPLNRTAQLGKWNPLFLKIALPNPRPVLNWLTPTMSWLFSRQFFFIWLGICFAGVYSVQMQWERFHDSLQDVFATENWLYLLIVWVVLKILHEAGHAVACERYGGSVTRCGLMFIVFSPIAWVDVTSAWSFRSKWRRIIVSAAGMYVEFLLAGIAAIVWSRTSDPLIATLSRNVVISASVTTLLFNLNFLMRFDGYYMLSDLLEIQNLYAAGQQYIQYAQRRYVLGMKAVRPNASTMKLALIRAYGIGAMIWRVTFCVGILIVAAQLFRGAGIVLAVFSGIIWFAVPLARFALTLLFGQGGEQPKRWRFAVLSTTCLACVAAALYAPWPGQTFAHGVVEYSPLQTVRANSPGFVREIVVNPGDHVAAGTVLLRLENRELSRELSDIDLQIQVQKIRHRVAHRDNEMALYETIGKKLDSLYEQRLQLATKVSTLTVQAPIDGTVIAHNLETLEGKYVKSGTELLSVGSTGEKEVRISIEQEDANSFRDPKNKEVRLAILGHSLSNRQAQLERINPRATRRVLHPCLAATSGGPLAIQQNASSDSSDEILLVEPHFEGVVTVPKSLSNNIRAGELCKVSIGRGHQRIYEKLYGLARSYFDSKADTASL